MSSNFGGVLSARLSAICQRVEPSDLAKHAISCAEEGHAVVIFDRPETLYSKRVLHQASLGDLWRQAATTPISVRLKFNDERRCAFLLFSRRPLPPAIAKLDALLFEY